MEQIRISSVEDKASAYSELMPQLRSLVDGEPDFIANAANVTAAMKQSLSHFSWVGVYLLKKGELVLGPFQGKVACTRIKVGSGVCGTAAAERKALIVRDVSKFPGHISCDPDSKSEIVVPLVKDGELFGVLDVDSSEFGAFDEKDKEYLEQVAELLSGKFIKTELLLNGG